MPQAPSDLQHAHNRRAAMAACAINALGSPLDLVVDSSAHVPLWPPLGASFVGVALLVFLWRHRGSRASAWAFLLNNTAVAASIWVTSTYFAAAGDWIPFQENKLGMIIVALLAPQLWVGLISIGTFAVSGLVKVALFDEAIRMELPRSEPAVLCIVALVSAALLAFRARALRYHDAAIVARADAVHLRRVTQAFRMLRHQANTPLQVLTLTTERLRAAHPELTETLDRQARAIERLKEISRRMAVGESGVTWTKGELSFDDEE